MPGTDQVHPLAKARATRNVGFGLGALTAMPRRDRETFTTHPDDFKGLNDRLTVVPVTRPLAPHDS